MEIPVARIFHKIQEKTRKELGYRPGVDDEAPPALGGSCPTQ
jgi:formate dehydrogenase subunit beta